MSAPPTTGPASCKSDDVESMPASAEPISTELLTAEEAEQRDLDAEQAEAQASYRSYLQSLEPVYEPGQPAEPDPGLTITIDNIRFIEADTPDDFARIVADVAYENRTDEVYTFDLFRLICGD